MAQPHSNPQMLLLEPKNVLKFYPPFTTRSTSLLEVTNPTPYSILYKIKTTASFRYYVTPKMGVLLPYSKEVVTIGMKAPRGETEDKFKIVAMVSPEAVESSTDLWEAFDESKAMTSKFTVEFVEENQKDDAAQSESAKETTASRLVDMSKVSIKKVLAFIAIGVLAAVSRYYGFGGIIQT